MWTKYLNGKDKTMKNTENNIEKQLQFQDKKRFPKEYTNHKKMIVFISLKLIIHFYKRYQKWMKDNLKSENQHPDLYYTLYIT